MVDENAELTAEEAQMVEWVNSFAVVFDEIKVQDPMTMSMKGKVEVLGETIRGEVFWDAETKTVTIIKY